MHSANPVSWSALRWLRRMLAAVLLLLILCAGAGLVYENISEARDRRFNPMPGRLLDVCDEDAHVRAAECNWDNAREGVAELKDFRESAAQAGATGFLGEMPLALLSHDPDKLSSEMPPDLAKSVNADWEKMQEDLAHLSTRGMQTIAKNSAHYIQIDRPDVVIDAVQRIVTQARANAAMASSSNY